MATICLAGISILTSSRIVTVRPAAVNLIDAFTDRTGRALAWLGLAMALLTALIVLARYGFNVGSIAAHQTPQISTKCVTSNSMI